MHKIVLTLVLLLLSSVMALGQYANTPTTDVTTTREYKMANTALYGGVITAGAGIAWIGNSRIKRIKNASGQTLASIGYASTGNGIAIAMRF